MLAFTRPSWRRAQALLCGALLTPANHVLTAALRALGLAGDARFQNYHCLLNRVRWSARAAAGTLLGLLVAAFVPDGPLILGLDETVERRRGPKIQARAIYRDAARSSRECFQKTSGLRCLSLHLLVPIRWARRRVGLAIFERPVALGALRALRAAGPPTQAAGRTGARIDRPSASLAAQAGSDRGGRQRLHRRRVARMV